MAIAQTHKTNFTSSSAATSHTVSLGWTATAGRLLVAIVNMDKTITSITDNLSGTWNSEASAVNFSGLYGYAKVAAGGETSVTVTPSSSAGATIVIFEYSGTNGRTSDGANGAVTGTNSTNITTPTITPPVAGDLLLVAFGTAGAAGTTESWSAGPSTSSPTWTITQEDNSHEPAAVGHNYCYVGSGSTSGSGSYLAVGTFTITYGLGGIIMSFKAATGSTFSLNGSTTEATSVSLKRAVAQTRSLTEATSAQPIVRAVSLIRAITKASAATVIATRVFLRSGNATQAQSARPLIRQFQLLRTVSQAQSLSLTRVQSLLRTIQAQVSQALSSTSQARLARTLGVGQSLTGTAEFSSGEIRTFAQTTQQQALSLQQDVHRTRLLQQPQTATLTYHVPIQYDLAGTVGVGQRTSYSLLKCLARTYGELELATYGELELRTYGDLERECLGPASAKRFIVCPRDLEFAVPERPTRFLVEVR